MEQPAINEHLVRRYLLGQLPDRERERLEVGMLTDDRYYETLTALEDEVEDELIDEYLDDELTGKERENFERVFLNTPERAHKLKVIKDLKDNAAAAAQPEVPLQRIVKPEPRYRQWIPAIGIFQNPLFGFATATALTVALLCCVWLWIRSNNLEAQLLQARTQHPTDSELRVRLEQLEGRNKELEERFNRSEEQRAGLQEELASLKARETHDVTPPNQISPPARSTFAFVTLSPSVRSSSNKSTLTLRPGNTEGHLELNVHQIDPKDYKRFLAVVKKQEGPEVWRDENVKLKPRANNARAVLKIPAEKLSEGQYVGELNGITADEQSETIGLYFFQVVRK